MENRKINQILWFCRIAFFINYVWFGTLKFFPGLSPAENLASQTISELTFESLSKDISIYSLAFFEVIIGISFLFNKLLKVALWLMITHMVLTFSTFIFFPELMFQKEFYSLTLAGQYVIKNLVFLSCGFLMLKTISKNN